MKKFGGGFNMKEIKLKRAPAEEFYRLKDEAQAGNQKQQKDRKEWVKHRNEDFA